MKASNPKEAEKIKTILQGDTGRSSTYLPKPRQGQKRISPIDRALKQPSELLDQYRGTSYEEEAAELLVRSKKNNNRNNSFVIKDGALYITFQGAACGAIPKLIEGFRVIAYILDPANRNHLKLYDVHASLYPMELPRGTHEDSDSLKDGGYMEGAASNDVKRSVQDQLEEINEDLNTTLAARKEEVDEETSAKLDKRIKQLKNKKKYLRNRSAEHKKKYDRIRIHRNRALEKIGETAPDVAAYLSQAIKYKANIGFEYIGDLEWSVEGWRYTRKK